MRLYAYQVKNIIKTSWLRAIFILLAVTVSIVLGGGSHGLKSPHPETAALIMGFYLFHCLNIGYYIARLCNKDGLIEIGGVYGELLQQCPSRSKYLWFAFTVTRNLKRFLLGAVSVLLVSVLFMESVYFSDFVVLAGLIVGLISISSTTFMSCRDVSKVRKYTIPSCSTLFSVCILLYMILRGFNETRVVIYASLVQVFVVLIWVVIFLHGKQAVPAYKFKRALGNSSYRKGKTFFSRLYGKPVFNMLPVPIRTLCVKEIAQIYREIVPLVTVLLLTTVTFTLLVIASRGEYLVFILGFIITITLFSFSVALNSVARESRGSWILRLNQIRRRDLLIGKYIANFFISSIGGIALIIIFIIVGKIFFHISPVRFVMPSIVVICFANHVAILWAFILGAIFVPTSIYKKGEIDYSSRGLEVMYIMLLGFVVGLPVVVLLEVSVIITCVGMIGYIALLAGITVKIFKTKFIK